MFSFKFLFLSCMPFTTVILLYVYVIYCTLTSVYCLNKRILGTIVYWWMHLEVLSLRIQSKWSCISRSCTVDASLKQMQIKIIELLHIWWKLPESVSIRVAHCCITTSFFPIFGHFSILTSFSRELLMRHDNKRTQAVTANQGDIHVLNAKF